MYSIQIHSIFIRIIAFFHGIGFWHRGDRSTVRERIVKCCPCIYYSLFVVSLAIGAMKRENGDEGIFLMEITVVVSVEWLKLCVLIWKQERILVMVNRIGVFSIKDEKDFAIFNDKIESFMKFVKVFLVAFVVALFVEVAVAPFLNSTNTLFFEIAFPLDWKHDTMSFWIANIFLFTEVGLCLGPLLFAITFWYLMLICASRYEVLGSELRNMCRTNDERRIHVSNEAWHKEFLQDLKSSIDQYVRLREYAQQRNESWGPYINHVLFEKWSGV